MQGCENYGGSGSGNGYFDNLSGLLWAVTLRWTVSRKKGPILQCFLNCLLLRVIQTLPDKEKKNLVNDEDAKDFLVWKDSEYY